MEPPARTRQSQCECFGSAVAWYEEILGLPEQAMAAGGTE